MVRLILLFLLTIWAANAHSQALSPHIKAYKADSDKLPKRYRKKASDSTAPLLTISQETYDPKTDFEKNDYVLVIPAKKEIYKPTSWDHWQAKIAERTYIENYCDTQERIHHADDIYPRPPKYQEHEDTVTAAQMRRDDARAQVDSLYGLYTKDYVKYRPYFIFPGPRRAEEILDIIYTEDDSKFKAVASTGLNYGLGSNTVSIYSDILSASMGLFRVTLGSQVAKSGNSDTARASKDEAYQRLISYGGNTVLTLEYPALYLHFHRNQYNVIGRLIARGTADFPSIGTSSDNWAGSAAGGFDLYADAATKKREFVFFGNFTFYKIVGTDAFKQTLGVAVRDFTFGHATIGVIFNNNIKISFALPAISSESSLKNNHVVAGTSILR